jgi:predicted methyltransferase
MGIVMIRPMFCRASAVATLAVLSMLAGRGMAAAQDAKAPDYGAIVASADRSEADRQTDQRRQPAKMLAFTGVRPGMKVLDMEANAGYSTELLARAVGPSGVVYAQDPAAVIERIVKASSISGRRSLP